MPRTNCLDSPHLVSLIAQVAVLEGQQVLRRRSRRRHPASEVAKSNWAPPDSANCRDAEAFCAKHASPALLNHSARTYAFGMALAAALDRRPDRELLYIASLLHDLGLTPAFDGADPFELRGAEAAYRWCVDNGLPEADAELVFEAIRLHTSLEAARREPEIALVHFGAGVDVLGYRIEDLHKSTIAAVLECWPRHNFKRELLELLRTEAKKTPNSPLGLQWRMGFAKRVEAAPFAE